MKGAVECMALHIGQYVSLQKNCVWSLREVLTDKTEGQALVPIKWNHYDTCISENHIFRLPLFTMLFEG